MQGIDGINVGANNGGSNKKKGAGGDDRDRNRDWREEERRGCIYGCYCGEIREGGEGGVRDQNSVVEKGVGNK